MKLAVLTLTALLLAPLAALHATDAQEKQPNYTSRVPMFKFADTLQEQEAWRWQWQVFDPRVREEETP